MKAGFHGLLTQPAGGGGGGTPVTFTNMGLSAAPDFNVSSVTTHVTPSHAPPTSGLMLLGVSSRHGSGPIIPTVTGNGVSWVSVGTIALIASLFRMTVFVANAAGATTGATTINWAAQGSQVNAMGVFAYASNVDVSGGAAAAVVQAVTNKSDAPVSSISANFATFGNTNNRPWMFLFRNSNEVITHRTNWTALDAMLSASFRGLYSGYRGDATDTAVSASWLTGSACGIIGLELKAA